VGHPAGLTVSLMTMITGGRFLITARLMRHQLTPITGNLIRKARRPHIMVTANISGRNQPDNLNVNIGFMYFVSQYIHRMFIAMK